MIKFEILGNTPSKKNTKNVVFIGHKCKLCGKGKRVVVLPPKNYNQWYVSAKKQILELNLPKISYPANITFYFYRKSSHRFDYNNISQSVLDLLVDMNVLQDDSAEFVTPIFCGYEKDKDNPRVLVSIYERDISR